MQLNIKIIYPSEKKLAVWHYVSSIQYLGPIRFRKLWNFLGNDIEEIFKMTDRELLELKGVVTPQVFKGIKEQRNQRAKSEKFAKEQLMRAENCGGRIVLLGDQDYPSFLHRSKMCHPILYCIGKLGNFSRYDKSIAILGTRKANEDSLSIANLVAKKLARQRWTIVSGMAKGIDASAHEGALDRGGRTIAVLGSGVDMPYPSEHRSLYNRIIENNLVCSEFPFSTRTNPIRLKKRNKTIVAFSLGAFVVQTSIKGGSMNAVKACKEQRKPVFSIQPDSSIRKEPGDYSGNREILATGGYPVDVSNADEEIMKICSRKSWLD